jgi:hypothetical protein
MKACQNFLPPECAPRCLWPHEPDAEAVSTPSRRPPVQPVLRRVAKEIDDSGAAADTVGFRYRSSAGTVNHRTPLDNHSTLGIAILPIIALKSLCRAGSSPIKIKGQTRNCHDTGYTLRNALSNCHHLEHPQVYASSQCPQPGVEHLSRWMCLTMSLKSKVLLRLFILRVSPAVHHPSHLGPNSKAPQITTTRLCKV